MKLKQVVRTVVQYVLVVLDLNIQKKKLKKMKLQAVDRKIRSIFIFKKGSKAIAPHFVHHFSQKNISVIFYYLTEFYCLIAFTSRDI